MILRRPDRAVVINDLSGRGAEDLVRSSSAGAGRPGLRRRTVLRGQALTQPTLADYNRGLDNIWTVGRYGIDLVSTPLEAFIRARH